MEENDIHVLRRKAELMTQAHDPKFPQSPAGSLYPKNYVVGIFDDLQEAQQASEAFKKAHFQAEEIRLMEGHEMVQKVQEIEEDKNWLQHFLSSFQATTDETGAHSYLQAAKEGKHILYVHADSPEDAEKISGLMRLHHGHTIKFFGTWAVTDVLPEQDKPMNN